MRIFRFIGVALCIVVLPNVASATTVYLTSGSSWTVPSDWNSANNSIEVIGGGGGGSGGVNSSYYWTSGGNGGGGGAYSKISNLSLTPGASIAYQIGAGGTASYDNADAQAGSDTWFRDASTVLAKGGNGASHQYVECYLGPGVGGGGAVGGSAAGGVGTVRYSGGNGGKNAYHLGGGGGGSGGPYGVGGAGGDASCGNPYGYGGAGGGGGGGGATGGRIWSNGFGSDGGNNYAGYGFGAGGTNFGVSGSPGSAGGGGGGGEIGQYGNGGNGGAGGNGIEWGTVGSGGGGGGGALGALGYPLGNGGAGGLYGAGGGGGGGDYGSSYGGNGARGVIVITYTPAPLSCSVTLSKNPSARGERVTVSWNSTNATSFTLTTIGPVTPNTPGSTSVSPSSSTSYGGTATGPGGTVTCPVTLTVNTPTASMTVNGASAATVSIGDSTTWSWSSTFGSTYSTSFTLDQADACGNGVGPNAWGSGNTASGSFSYTWTTCSANRTYAYTYRVQNSAGYAVTSGVSVSVRPLPACTISLSPSTILRGQNSTMTYSSSNATGGTIAPLPGAVGVSGTYSAAPQNTTTYTGTFTGAGGTATCNATLTVNCAPLYSCNGQTIQYTDASCTTTDVTTCTAPNYCTAGQSSCTVPQVTFNPGTSSSGAPLTGHLEAKPQLVRTGGTSRVYWNVSNVSSCTVSGNGETLVGAAAGCSGNTCTSGTSGHVTPAINTTVEYTLSCTPLAGTFAPENAKISVSPTYNER